MWLIATAEVWCLSDFLTIRSVARAAIIWEAIDDSRGVYDPECLTESCAAMYSRTRGDPCSASNTTKKHVPRHVDSMCWRRLNRLFHVNELNEIEYSVPE